MRVGVAMQVRVHVVGQQLHQDAGGDDVRTRLEVGERFLAVLLRVDEAAQPVVAIHDGLGQNLPGARAPRVRPQREIQVGLRAQRAADRRREAEVRDARQAIRAHQQHAGADSPMRDRFPSRPAARGCQRVRHTRQQFDQFGRRHPRTAGIEQTARVEHRRGFVFDPERGLILLELPAVTKHVGGLCRQAILGRDGIAQSVRQARHTFRLNSRHLQNEPLLLRHAIRHVAIQRGRAVAARRWQSIADRRAARKGRSRIILPIADDAESAVPPHACPAQAFRDQ